MQWLQALNELKLPDLIQGSHPDGPEHGMCAMEMISFMERQPFSDKPTGVCEILRGFVIAANDTLPHDQRQKLKRILPSLVDTEVEMQHMDRRRQVLENLVIRNWDYYTGSRERYRDMERDCMRYGYRPDPRARDHAYHMMSQGPAGWMRLLQECLPPWNAADIMISMLEEAIAVTGKKPRVEFNTTGGNKKKQVKKLAEVVYLPEAKRKTGNYVLNECLAEVSKKVASEIDFKVLHGTSIVKPEHAFVHLKDIA